VNINFGLLPPVETGQRRLGKKDRQEIIATRALERLGECQPV
jgi:folate-dependent tRNA-U54 methylase TrmFO/GidA